MMLPRRLLHWTIVFRLLTVTISGVVLGMFTAAVNPSSPTVVPLIIERNARGTYKADIAVGIGNLRQLPMAFDTGSTGLHVFAAAPLQSPGSGVLCSTKPITFTVGNPARIIYNGVACTALLHLGTVTTPVAVPIAYLTSARCAPSNAGCRVPNLMSPKAHGGVYGVFGAGITGPMPLINPLLTLSQGYGPLFSVVLTPRDGELVLGEAVPPGAIPFPLVKSTNPDAHWEKGQTCLFINGRSTNACLAISFDTGNGVPWIHDADATVIPQAGGLVTPSTRIDFGSPNMSEEATSVVAGTSFADSIKVESSDGKPLTNTGIAAFFNHVVTYDFARGVIWVSAGGVVNGVRQ